MELDWSLGGNDWAGDAVQIFILWILTSLNKGL